MWAVVGGYLLMFLARVTDVTLATLRMLFLVRGKRFHAAAIGLFEVSIYIIALKYVMERLDEPVSLIFYALGFATGNIVGSMIEEKVALGQVSVQVITLHQPLELAEVFRSAGYGVTVTEGYGREGVHLILNLSLPRKRLSEVQEQVRAWDPQAFMVINEVRSVYGGFCRSGRKGK
ncbi:MAG: DUF2179 domain-containing protein [Thermoanaerobacteraceae bacterium]|uniref:DUF2179 domain-containing protein n=1 Tax=Thermanaeromonas sp. C210 TaxID=2731925 RepID=UPI00155C3C5B|nr:DUF2179 domain-containing protein [Thermanaeromonas sp. C210]MBE3581615.1 DUF2179 domain-containing protein [Thermoanaerobacteraceae bacterium]GFN21875.1 UPF0316 protein [Thermanaeromonas sp. C210]